MHSKLIGLVGGMGPYAALDVNKKIFDNTIAEMDEDHLNVVLLSLCEAIPGRTKFLSGEIQENPATALAQKIRQFHLDIVGVACNTFHAPAIFDEFELILKKENPNTQIVHLLDEIK